MILRELATGIHALLLALICLPASTLAQELPQTAIWLAELGTDGLPGQPLRITEADGYHNQPHFSADSRYVYFSAEAEGAQTDILVHDLEDGVQHVLSAAPYSDFSPTPIPEQNAISVVRVEADSKQRLWRIDLATGEESLLFEMVEPVGYHAWLTGASVAMFILGDTFDLHFASIGHDGSNEVFKNIGRTLRVHRGNGELYFVDKNNEPWHIAAIDPATLRTRSVIPLLPEVEDFELDAQGRLWSGDGGKLYVSDSRFQRWVLAADLSEFGIHDVTRLAASPDGRWLAIVSSR